MKYLFKDSGSLWSVKYTSDSMWNGFAPIFLMTGHPGCTLNSVPMTIAKVVLMWRSVFCWNGTFAIVNAKLQNTIHHLQQQEITPAMHWQ